MPHRPFLVGLVACMSLLVACGDDDTDTVTESGSGTTVVDDQDGTTTTDGTGSSTTATTAPEIDGAVVEVSVAGGEVVGGGRHEVDLGDTVTIRVTSDIDDHIHLHGYDVMVDVAAGETAELTFEATIPGVFEVELEDSRIQLVELEIS